MSNPLEDFDPTIISGVLTEMLRQIISGPTEEIEVEVKVKVPKAIVEGFEKISGVLGVDVNELLGNLASHGVQASLQGLTQVKQADPPANGTPSVSEANLGIEGLGLDAFGEGFSQLGDLMNQLKNVQEMVTNAAIPFGYEDPDSKDPEES